MSPHCLTHEPHRRTSDATTRCAEDPSVATIASAPWTHHGATAEVRELLEALDDAMFAAIAGDAGSLDKARTLWGEAVATLPLDLVDESREQYLRFAAETTRHVETADLRNPAAAVTALEVLELLTR